MEARVKAFLGEELILPRNNPLDYVIGQDTREDKDMFSQHERARLVMAEWEDIIFSAVVRALAACLGEK
ncbi:hypothetical protein SAMN02745150_01191 [Brevinema andersonii]|uniref:Uncharacterized protein n=1 Tax=Brevinema andersonii TaxID=34097 RepID=A0A1I1EUF7_BREAD|nr:hypothetical protein [Brevinema andersonii]SFB88553.1 hypothetical protein SAMN02745150_01191 [Brevinema andersonii]